MSHQDWKEAEETWRLLLDEKGDIILDSYAAFIPIAERRLSLCKQR